MSRLLLTRKLAEQKPLRKKQQRSSFLQEFLPQAASEQEVLAVIEAAIEEARASGAQGPAVMGKVMATVKQALAGRAEMAAVSQQVKAKLS